MPKPKKIALTTFFDPQRKRWDSNGDGSCWFKLNTTERELAKLLTAFPSLNGMRLKMTLEIIGKVDDKNKRKENSKTGVKRAPQDTYR